MLSIFDLDDAMLLACGQCVYERLILYFPPTETFCVIFPLWLVALASIQALWGSRLEYTPSLAMTVALLAAVFILGPATFGPALGLWIPYCCIGATIGSLRKAPRGDGELATESDGASPNRVKNAVRICAIVAVFGLIAGSVYDYYTAGRANGLRQKLEQRHRIKAAK